MKKLILAAIMLLIAATSQAADLAYAETTSGILYLTDVKCSTEKQANPKLKILQIKHVEKGGRVIRGCYAAFDNGIVYATFANGDEYEYALHDFQWTDEGLRRLGIDPDSTKQEYDSVNKHKKMI